MGPVLLRHKSHACSEAALRHTPGSSLIGGELNGPVGGRRRARGTPNRHHSPPSGCPKGGSEFKYRPQPNWLWGHPKGPLGTSELHLSGPILPCIRPERGNPLFWPPDARAPQQAKKKGRNGAKPEPAMGMAGGDLLGALGTAGAMGEPN